MEIAGSDISGEVTISTGRTMTKPPGNQDVWVLILIDAFFFLVYFLVFITARIKNPALFELGRQQLNPLLGFANTLILVTSSWFVVRAVRKAKVQSPGPVKCNLMIAMMLGGLFAVLKVIGYMDDFSEGHAFMTNGIFGFFGYYYVLTGIHFFHVIAGISILLVCFIKTGPGKMDKNFRLWIESGASFWHLVDLLWVVLFPMFYLLKGIS